MRILHTADWHMNRKIGRQNLNDDICSALEQIAGYLDEYQVDVMIVAGDILETTSRIQEMKRAVSDIRRIFSPFLERGGTIICISGNHDNEVFFETLRDALALVGPSKSRTDKLNSTGRLYVAPNARILRLPDPNGNMTQFVLMPYPTSRAYITEKNARFESVEEKHRAIQQAFKNRLNYLEGKIDVSIPAVLVSHIHVRGIQPHALYRLTEAEDILFEQGDIPTHWAYVAYGHIHKPQPAITGSEYLRYAGSVTKLDGSERDDEKSVVLCELDSTGRVGEPRLLPLDTPPMYRIEITDPDIQIPKLQEQYPEAETALVHYTLHLDPSKHHRETLCREIESIFPRWYDRRFREIGQAQTPVIAFDAQKVQDVVGTVRSYLDMRLKDHPRREALIALAESLMTEGGEQ